MQNKAQKSIDLDTSDTLLEWANACLPRGQWLSGIGKMLKRKLRPPTWAEQVNGTSRHHSEMP